MGQAETVIRVRQLRSALAQDIEGDKRREFDSGRGQSGRARD